MHPMGKVAQVRADPRVDSYVTNPPPDVSSRPDQGTSKARTTGVARNEPTRPACFASNNAYSHPLPQDARYAQNYMPYCLPQNHGQMQPPGLPRDDRAQHFRGNHASYGHMSSDRNDVRYGHPHSQPHVSGWPRNHPSTDEWRHPRRRRMIT